MIRAHPKASIPTLKPSTNDKTSRLMMKSFSTMRDTWKGAQSYTERRRGRREIDVTRTRRGGNHKGREQASH